MIFVQMSNLAKAIIHKCLPKARHSSVFSLGFSFLIFGLVCSSCGGTKVIPLRSLHEFQVHDTIVLHNIQYDSIYVASDHYVDRSEDTILIKDKQIEYRYASCATLSLSSKLRLNTIPSPTKSTSRRSSRSENRPTLLFVSAI